MSQPNGGAGVHPLNGARDSKLDSDAMFEVYIQDYLAKRNYTATAQEFKKESRFLPSQIPTIIDAPCGFLLEWWTVFWEIFNAKSNPSASEAGHAYIEGVNARREQMAVHNPHFLGPRTLSRGARDSQGFSLPLSVDPALLAEGQGGKVPLQHLTPRPFTPQPQKLGDDPRLRPTAGQLQASLLGLGSDASMKLNELSRRGLLSSGSGGLVQPFNGSLDRGSPLHMGDPRDSSNLHAALQSLQQHSHRNLQQQQQTQAALHQQQQQQQDHASVSGRQATNQGQGQVHSPALMRPNTGSPMDRISLGSNGLSSSGSGLTAWNSLHGQLGGNMANNLANSLPGTPSGSLQRSTSDLQIPPGPMNSAQLQKLLAGGRPHELPSQLQHLLQAQGDSTHQQQRQLLLKHAAAQAQAGLGLASPSSNQYSSLQSSLDDLVEPSQKKLRSELALSQLTQLKQHALLNATNGHSSEMIGLTSRLANYQGRMSSNAVMNGLLNSAGRDFQNGRSLSSPHTEQLIAQVHNARNQLASNHMRQASEMSAGLRASHGSGTPNLNNPAGSGGLPGGPTAALVALGDRSGAATPGTGVPPATPAPGAKQRKRGRPPGGKKGAAQGSPATTSQSTPPDPSAASASSDTKGGMMMLPPGSGPLSRSNLSGLSQHLMGPTMPGEAPSPGGSQSLGVRNPTSSPQPISHEWLAKITNMGVPHNGNGALALPQSDGNNASGGGGPGGIKMNTSSGGDMSHFPNPQTDPSIMAVLDQNADIMENLNFEFFDPDNVLEGMDSEGMGGMRHDNFQDMAPTVKVERQKI